MTLRQLEYLLAVAQTGSFTEAAILYWARKGNPGYTVVFPFYWH